MDMWKKEFNIRLITISMVSASSTLTMFASFLFIINRVTLMNHPIDSNIVTTAELVLFLAICFNVILLADNYSNELFLNSTEVRTLPFTVLIKIKEWNVIYLRNNGWVKYKTVDGVLLVIAKRETYKKYICSKEQFKNLPIFY